MRTLVEVEADELEGAALDWAMAKAADYEPSIYRADGLDGSVSYDVGLPTMSVKKPYTRWSPSTDWSQGGPLIEEYKVDLTFEWSGRWYGYVCTDDGLPGGADAFGKTPLIAACRAIAGTKLGGLVKVPAELLEETHA